MTPPQQWSPNSGVFLGCWGPPQAPERAEGMGAEGFLRAGDRKTAAQVDSRVKKAPVPAEYLCLTEKSAY